MTNLDGGYNKKCIYNSAYSLKKVVVGVVGSHHQISNIFLLYIFQNENTCWLNLVFAETDNHL